MGKTKFVGVHQFWSMQIYWHGHLLTRPPKSTFSNHMSALLWWFRRNNASKLKGYQFVPFGFLQEHPIMVRSRIQWSRSYLSTESPTNGFGHIRDSRVDLRFFRASLQELVWLQDMNCHIHIARTTQPPPCSQILAQPQLFWALMPFLPKAFACKLPQVKKRGCATTFQKKNGGMRNPKTERNGSFFFGKHRRANQEQLVCPAFGHDLAGQTGFKHITQNVSTENRSCSNARTYVTCSQGTVPETRVFKTGQSMGTTTGVSRCFVNLQQSMEQTTFRRRFAHKTLHDPQNTTSISTAWKTDR